MTLPAGSRHPGEGYSESAYERDGKIFTSDIDDAHLALHEGRRVELDQEISTLIDKLGETAAQYAAMSERAPLFDLCNVTVPGTSLFCSRSHGIPRIEMPQLARDQIKPFVKFLKRRGYEAKKGRELASHLHATQNQLDGAKVASIIRRMDGRGRKKAMKRLVICRDNYILDGHHSWAAKIGLDARDGNLKSGLKLDVWRINISITRLLEVADEFTGGKGKKPAGVARLREEDWHGT